jgi:hypothetical protein
LADELGFAIHADRLADFPTYWQVIFRKFQAFSGIFLSFPPILKIGTPSAKKEATPVRRHRNMVREDVMFGFDKIDMQRMLVSALGALALSATCVVAAVGPAGAASPAPTTAQVQQFAAK